jgi:hypothetical protein
VTGPVAVGDGEGEHSRGGLEADRDWYESFHRHAVDPRPLGTFANAAVRATVVKGCDRDPLDERLAAMDASGTWVAAYFFYRVVRAGFRVVREPAATGRLMGLTASRQPGWREAYVTGRAEAAFHLTTLLRHGDMRAAVQLGWRQPSASLARLRGYKGGHEDWRSDD